MKTEYPIPKVSIAKIEHVIGELLSTSNYKYNMIALRFIELKKKAAAGKKLNKQQKTDLEWIQKNVVAVNKL